MAIKLNYASQLSWEMMKTKPLQEGKKTKQNKLNFKPELKYYNNKSLFLREKQRIKNTNVIDHGRNQGLWTRAGGTQTKYENRTKGDADY